MGHQQRQDSVKSTKDEGTFTFEEAVTLAGLGKFHYVLLLGCAMGQFGVVFQLYITSYLLPSVQCDFRINVQEKGLLTSISYVGVLLGSYLWGLLADTRGRKTALVSTLLLDAVCGLLSSFAPDFYTFLALRFLRVLLGSYLWGLLADTRGRKTALVSTLLLDAVCGLLSSFAPDFYTFLALRFLSGFFICCAAAVVFPYVGEFFNSRDRPTAVMVATAYLPLGLLVLPGIAWLVIPQSWSVQLPWCNYNSWRILVAICSVPSAVGSLLTAWVLPESPKYLMVRGETEETLKVLRHMYAMNTGDKEVYYKVQNIVLDDENVDSISRKSLVQQLKDMWFEQTLPLFKMPHIPRALLFFVFEFGIFGCFNSLALWLPDIFNNMASFTLANGRSGTICQSMDFALHGQTANHSIEMEIQNSSALPSLWLYTVSVDVNSSSESIPYTETEEFNSIGTDTCEVTINPETFLNSLIISTCTVIINLGLGVALRWIKQKPIMLVFLSVSFASIIALNFVQDDSIALMLVCFFFCTCATSGSLMLSAAVDLFPTNLRGMTVCLAMMMARAGVVVGSQTIAALIEYSCSAVFYIQAGVTLVCFILAYLLPDRTKK